MPRIETRPTKRQFQGSFKTKPLPKQEYYLLRMLQEEYGITDPADFVTILLRVFYELHHMTEPLNGVAKLHSIIDTWRLNPEEERTYMLK